MNRATLIALLLAIATACHAGRLTWEPGIGGGPVEYYNIYQTPTLPTAQWTYIASIEGTLYDAPIEAQQMYYTVTAVNIAAGENPEIKTAPTPTRSTFTKLLSPRQNEPRPIKLAARASAAAYAIPRPRTQPPPNHRGAGHGPLWSRVDDALPPRRLHRHPNQGTASSSPSVDPPTSTIGSSTSTPYLSPALSPGKIHVGFANCYNQIKKAVSPQSTTPAQPSANRYSSPATASAAPSPSSVLIDQCWTFDVGPDVRHQRRHLRPTPRWQRGILPLRPTRLG
jgi:hypothetical protein